MTTSTRPAGEVGRQDAFFHPALFYGTPQEYLDGLGAFVRDALDDGQPVLVAVPRWRLPMLRDALGDGREHVTWVDMTEAGRNPGRILSMLQEFADRRGPSTPVSIVGEPIWVGRTPGETWEATRHEALINLAFQGRRASILCPYDTALPGDVLAQAYRTHPVVGSPGAYRASSRYTDPHDVCRDCDVPLPEPADAVVVPFGERDLAATRDEAGDWAAAAGLSPARRTDWLLAVSEAVSNSVRHGGGEGTLRMWRANGGLVAEISDRGRLDNPLTGRRRPDPCAPTGGRGCGSCTSCAIWWRSARRTGDSSCACTWAWSEAGRRPARLTARPRPGLPDAPHTARPDDRAGPGRHPAACRGSAFPSRWGPGAETPAARVRNRAAPPGVPPCSRPGRGRTCRRGRRS
ncbi:MEDS domain-containing protein [Streptomyces sudanensis]|uniref:anti-sigma factor RsbA family regulatory protein n=1 Tax=Streptomyces sudanensis TaxID=436397 RepID=UPI0020CD8DE5|nr:anti-sigma factor RsbA family regulatory protein [Streptomyces sudanensis]MCP9985508.1 MEDS domain-containing protein [Streptomyces sudanensis]